MPPNDSILSLYKTLPTKLCYVHMMTKGRLQQLLIFNYNKIYQKQYKNGKSLQRTYVQDRW